MLLCQHRLIYTAGSNAHGCTPITLICSYIRDCLLSPQVVFCVGSRWANVHWGAKTLNKGAQQQYVPPPVPVGYEQLKHAEQVQMYCVLSCSCVVVLYSAYVRCIANVCGVRC